MTINLSDFGIDRLSVQEQIQLAEAIYIAVENDRQQQQQPISAELKAELDRRVAEYRANPHEVISGDEMIARAMARIRE